MYYLHRARSMNAPSPSLFTRALVERAKILAFVVRPILASFERKQHLAQHHSSLLTLSNDLITSLQMSMYFKPSLSTGEHVVGEL